MLSSCGVELGDCAVGHGLTQTLQEGKEQGHQVVYISGDC